MKLAYMFLFICLIYSIDVFDSTKVKVEGGSCCKKIQKSCADEETDEKPQARFRCPSSCTKTQACTCGGLLCVCTSNKQSSNEKSSPEIWFVKSNCPKEDNRQPSKVRSCFLKPNFHDFDCCQDVQEFKKQHKSIAKKVETDMKKKQQGICPNEPSRQPFVICDKNKTCPGSVQKALRYIDICTDCSRCEIQKDAGKRGVVIRALQCRPLGRCGVEKPNPTLNQMNSTIRSDMKLKIRYLMMKDKETIKNSSLVASFAENGIKIKGF